MAEWQSMIFRPSALACGLYDFDEA